MKKQIKKKYIITIITAETIINLLKREQDGSIMNQVNSSRVPSEEVVNHEAYNNCINEMTSFFVRKFKVVEN